MQSPAFEGPYFDELAIGQEFGGAPGLTLTPGLAAAHQAITGDRLALALDHELCRQVTDGGPLASPSLVWDIAIGQSTMVTQHVKANLFYRGLAFRRAPRLGDTLRTAQAVGRKLYGFAEHEMSSTFLGTSTGLRRRHEPVFADPPDVRRRCVADAGLVRRVSRRVHARADQPDLPALRHDHGRHGASLRRRDRRRLGDRSCGVRARQAHRIRLRRAGGRRRWPGECWAARRTRHRQARRAADRRVSQK